MGQPGGAHRTKTQSDGVGFVRLSTAPRKKVIRFSPSPYPLGLRRPAANRHGHDLQPGEIDKPLMAHRTHRRAPDGPYRDASRS
jgi:hypothetical protein